MQKILVVTGANKGIGLSITKIALEKFFKVVAISRSTDNLEILEKEYPDTLHICKTDINAENSLSVIENLIKKLNIRIDVLINNAGLLINKPFVEFNFESADQILKTNFLSPAFLIQKLIPFINTNGHVINIASMGGFQGSTKFSGLSFYSAAKGALAILTECLALELSDQSIYCNALALGAVQTEMLNEAFPGYEAPVSSTQMGQFIFDFAIAEKKYFNGKVLPVSLSTP